MLTRTGRQPLHTATTTTEVGPGAYEAPSKFGQAARHAVAPFGSTATRSGTLPNVDTNPGPGAYFDEAVSGAKVAPKAKARPSPQFASKQARIPVERSQVEAQNLPGPGSYTGDLVVGPRARPARPGSGVAMHAAEGINWVKVATAPSIPTVAQSYGYEEGPGGALVLQGGPYKGHTGRDDDTAGPGEYNASDRIVKPVRHTTNFGASSGKRHDPVGKGQDQRPGPGSYEVATAGTSDAFRGGVMAQRQTSAFASTTKRKTTLTKDGPGPGAYRNPSSFQPLNEHLAAHPENFASFGRTLAETRPLTESEANPGPGDYDPAGQVTAHNSSKAKGLSVMRSKAGRFASSGPAPGDEPPGPGAYERAADTMVSKLGHRVNGRFGAFGSTSSRFVPERKAESTAAPGSYDPPPAVKNPAEARRRDQRSSAFRSSSKRTGLAAPASAAPAFYAPPSEPAKPTSTSRSFISSQPRFAEARSTDVPGPGQYDPQRPEKKPAAVGTNVGRAPRFEAQRVDANPGPGSYETTPSMTRRTFNISIGA